MMEEILFLYSLWKKSKLHNFFTGKYECMWYVMKLTLHGMYSPVAFNGRHERRDSHTTPNYAGVLSVVSTLTTAYFELFWWASVMFIFLNSVQKLSSLVNTCAKKSNRKQICPKEPPSTQFQSHSPFYNIKTCLFLSSAFMKLWPCNSKGYIATS